MDYEAMLDKGIEQLPESTKNTERFEIPKVLGHVQGNKTVISNFAQIAQTLRRDPAHLLKYILKELATPGELDQNRMIIGRKVPASEVNQRIVQYATTFVICTECKRPDTALVKEGNTTTLKCSACGASRPVHAKI
ncbi:MAG: translation initiation factor IF-2 subunit beta [Nanoarchaeota archaeon]